MKSCNGSEIKNMRKTGQIFFKGLFFVGLFLITALMSGCATNRGIIDLQVTAPANPQGGTLVKISRVTDSRVFELKPTSASIPSLKNGEIGNKAITARAIARKRNGFGKAMGDILLPEGKTVEILTREALVRSLREKGFQVLEPSDPGYENAIAVEADIYQFWAWITPGFWAMKLDFEARVLIKGDIGAFKTGQEVRSSTRLHTQAAGTRAWTNILKQGVDDLVKQVKETI
ncbi:MAG: hypothetical protein KAS94_15265 [Desulfobulbaceae bacterium]|nr:hypothetical protein [Desulfobulbaceae bacterium]